MRLFVANVTDQNHEFRYRMPENKKERIIMIPARHQVMLPDKDLTTTDIDYIVEYYGKYGFVSVSEAGKRRRFVGLCYGVDKQVPGVKLELQYRSNYDAKIDEGALIRKETAVASSEALTRELSKQVAGSGVELPEAQKFTTIVQEEETKDGFSSNKPVNEGFMVESGRPIVAKRGRR